ncbi:hypothetical protein J6590_056211 [Homalodisca vitripennis]|nr:hypothetical protein J6590_056211 [Homalodisca vitripennis]
MRVYESEKRNAWSRAEGSGPHSSFMVPTPHSSLSTGSVSPPDSRHGHGYKPISVQSSANLKDPDRYHRAHVTDGRMIVAVSAVPSACSHPIRAHSRPGLRDHDMCWRLKYLSR